MKRPTVLRWVDRGLFTFRGVHGVEVAPMDLDNARVARISELERYIDYLEERIAKEKEEVKEVANERLQTQPHRVQD